MNRWNTKDPIDYTDLGRLKSILVGRSIVSTRESGTGYNKTISFALDDGSVLMANASDGGCACSNGCFSVKNTNVPSGTITNVELTEVARNWWDDKETHEVTPGSMSDGTATIRLFVYTDMTEGRQEIVESEGSDNGYYGWGFWLALLPSGYIPSATEEDDE